MTTELYTLALARAQRSEELSPQLYNVLASTAAHVKRHDHATIPSLAISLGVTFNAIQQHLIKSSQLFVIDRKRWGKAGMSLISLSEEGLALLVTIDTKTRAYAEQIEAELAEASK